MESAGRRIRSIKSPRCLPSIIIRNSNHSSSSSSSAGSRLLFPKYSPITLLERFREVVFRLIMLNAISKDTNRQEEEVVPKRRRTYYPAPNQHHDDAVAECIDFIKRSGSTLCSVRGSTASSSSSDDMSDADQIVLSAIPIVV